MWWCLVREVGHRFWTSILGFFKAMHACFTVKMISFWKSWRATRRERVMWVSDLDFLVASSGQTYSPLVQNALFPRDGTVYCLTTQTWCNFWFSGLTYCMHHKNKKFALGQLFLCFERRYIPHLHKSENNSKRSKKRYCFQIWTSCWPFLNQNLLNVYLIESWCYFWTYCMHRVYRS